MEGPEFYFLVFQNKRELRSLLKNKCIYQALMYIPSNTSKLESAERGTRKTGTQIFVVFFNELSRDEGLEKLQKYRVCGIPMGTKGLLIKLLEASPPDIRVTRSRNSEQVPGTRNYAAKPCRQHSEALELHVSVLRKVLALPGVIKVESRGMPETG